MLDALAMATTPTWARIERMMSDRGIASTADLARLSGVQEQTLYKLRNGSSVAPSARTAGRLADALGCSVTWLLTGAADWQEMSEDDRRLIQAFRAMSPEERAAWLRLLEARAP